MFDTDASLSGYGLVSGHDWQGGFFDAFYFPEEYSKCELSHEHWVNVHAQESQNINYLELMPIWLALQRYSSVWKDTHVLCLTDNTQVVAALRKGHSLNKLSMVLLRIFFWICAKNNIYITPRHIAGSLNIVPDMLSRIGNLYKLSDIKLHSVCCSEYF